MSTKRTPVDNRIYWLKDEFKRKLKAVTSLLDVYDGHNLKSFSGCVKELWQEHAALEAQVLAVNYVCDAIEKELSRQSAVAGEQ